MSDASHVARSLRERLGSSTEDRLGKALSELLENPLLTGAIGRAFDAREKAVQAQEVAMGALNLPSAADIERLTRRLRSVSLRLEGIEDGVERLDRALAPSGKDRSEVAQRLSAIEAQLQLVTDRLDRTATPSSEAKAARGRTAGKSKARSRAGASGSKAKAKSRAGASGSKAKAQAEPRAAAGGSKAQAKPRAAKA